MYNVGQKTHVVTEAQLPCVGEHHVDITVTRLAETFKVPPRDALSLYLILDSALKSSLFSFLEWGTKVTWLLQSTWIRCV